jgi:hypothetical protein
MALFRKQLDLAYIHEVRHSASDLLSLTSFFDGQAISEVLLQEKGSGQAEGEEEGSTVGGNAGERSD